MIRQTRKFWSLVICNLVPTFFQSLLSWPACGLHWLALTSSLRVPGSKALCDCVLPCGVLCSSCRYVTVCFSSEPILLDSSHFDNFDCPLGGRGRGFAQSLVDFRLLYPQQELRIPRARSMQFTIASQLLAEHMYKKERFAKLLGCLRHKSCRMPATQVILSSWTNMCNCLTM